MSSSDAFELLGLKRNSATLSDVKKAYAKKLKLTRPDDDPEGFMRLRDAFAYTKTVARANDDRSVSKDAAPETSEEPVPPIQTEKVKYWHDQELGYHFNSSPIGKFVEKTIRWLRQEPTNPKAFFNRIAGEIENSNFVTLRDYQSFIIGHIFVSAVDQDESYDLEPWEVPVVTRPTWLSDDIVVAIHEEIDVLGFQPAASWEAQQLNCVINIFQPVLALREETYLPPEMSDALSLFENEQTEQNGDTHGSFFDRIKKQWVDMSPVARAMRELQSALDDPKIDYPTRIWREVLRRDELQTLDEFQDLDQRLRNFVSQETGLYSDKKAPDIKPWLSKSMVLLLDENFGWSGQFGRHMYERNQYEWLHKVVSKYRTIEKPNAHFKRVQEQPEPVSSPGVLGELFIWLINPFNMLKAYFGFRVLQTIWRLL